MADEKKPDPNIDDWDSLPLDPDGDDWDDPPEGEAPVSSAQAAGDGFDVPLPERDESAAGLEPSADDIDSPGGAATDGFDLSDASPADDFDAPASPPADDFDAPSPAPADDFDAPSPAPHVSGGAPDDQDDDFGAHLAAMSIGDQPSSEADGERAAASAAEDPPLIEPATKKVELDIEGIFLDDYEDAPPSDNADEDAPDGEPAEEPQAPPSGEEPAPPVEEGRKKIPRMKLLVIVVPVVLLLGGLGFGVYKLFFASEPPPPPPPLVIDPRVPHRDPEPGDLALGSFYINFPGSPNETIVEMNVVLHYNDLPDKMIIEDKMPVIRDIIFRLTQSKGGQVVSNGEIQRSLRQELVAQANLALGGEHISYIQINQFRILH